MGVEGEEAGDEVDGYEEDAGRLGGGPERGGGGGRMIREYRGRNRRGVRRTLCYDMIIIGSKSQIVMLCLWCDAMLCSARLDHVQPQTPTQNLTMASFNQAQSM